MAAKNRALEEEEEEEEEAGGGRPPPQKTKEQSEDDRLAAKEDLVARQIDFPDYDGDQDLFLPFL